jgi:DNA-binding SARP family transcriptional activator
MTPLLIYVLGGFRVYRGDEPVDDFPTRKAQSLFCYLILNRHRFHRREILADMLWGRSEPRNARRCLNTALWRLRRVLESHEVEPGAYLIVERERISFNSESDYWLDVEEFQTLCTVFGSQSRDANPDTWDVDPLRRAVELYQGDLMDGFYDDWCLYERERLHQTFLRILSRLMVYHGAKAQYDEGIAYGQRILSLDPLREEVHREVMRYCQLAGRRACALRQFEACQRALREELGTDPMPETMALYRRIQERRRDEGELLAEHQDALTSQTRRALAQLHGALERFDEAKRQLHRAMVTMEELTMNLNHKV